MELGHDKIGDVMRHLGHALLDVEASEEDLPIVRNYLQSIDPYKKLINKKPSIKDIDQYDAKCALAAKNYLESNLADE
ncbi:hypothetical protein [Paenibacillus lacisoli]|uniref:hypothetical protein n=1 Tax=Paenibacillus lacisoli TaxID=3064525 RepID=UPI00272AE5B0|nr:hypothetical protein [Paenibacillus sp. JX-17]